MFDRSSKRTVGKHLMKFSKYGSRWHVLCPFYKVNLNIHHVCACPAPWNIKEYQCEESLINEGMLTGLHSGPSILNRVLIGVETRYWLHESLSKWQASYRKSPLSGKILCRQLDSQGGITHDNFILERHNLKRYRDLYSLTSVSSHWQKCGSRRELFQRLCTSKTHYDDKKITCTKFWLLCVLTFAWNLKLDFDYKCMINVCFKFKVWRTTLFLLGWKYIHM
jgi:hypothetical protein